MSWDIEIEHIAGILSGSATIEPGLNAVRASNWQGKSSFVEAIKTGLGVSTALTEGQEHGSVHLHRPGQDVTVELARENGEVHRDGDPILTDDYDVIRTALFACLDETNEVRRIVRQGENLEEILLRPLDFQNIDERIADLKHEREQVDDELARAREAKKRLPTITERVTRLEDELADLREKHAALESESEGAGSVQSTQSDLAQARSDREQAESRIERLERAIERTEARLAEKRDELDGIEIPDDEDVEAELEETRERLDERKRDLEVLQSVYSATELVLTENRLDLITEVQRELTGDTVLCWTCGSEVERDAIESRLEDLGERVATLRSTIESQQEAVERLESRREDRKQSRRRRRDLSDEIDRLEEKLAEQRQSLEDARERHEKAEQRIEDLSESVDETVEEITDVESDIKYREAELKDARSELDSLETRADRIETLADEREELQEEIDALRNRKDELTYATREAFDEAMDDILTRFDTGFETARLTADFDLVVARDGREASLDALSDGELELLGFVAALAGYEAFDVAQAVPIMLVDGVGGLDDDNHHMLIEYLRDRTEYLVFTVYPEYGAFEGTEIDPTQWTIATDRQTVRD
ncbi:MAG: archaea-specific SMC-related protein [Halapricum sp.]